MDSPARTDALGAEIDAQRATCPVCGSSPCSLQACLISALVESEYLRVHRVHASLPSGRIALHRCPRCGLGFFRPPAAGGEDFYRDLHSLDWYYPADKPEYRFAAGIVRPTDTVLEVGGGEGAFGKLLNCRSYRLLELNGAAVEAARQVGLDASEEDLATHARSNPARFDVVCAFQVLEHVPEPREFLAAAVVALRPGGRLIVSVPADDSFIGRDRRNVLNAPPHHLTRWSDSSLRMVGEVLGLETERLHHESLTSWHVRDYAAGKADALLCLLARRPWQPLDPTLIQPLPRLARGALAAVIYPAVWLLRSRLRGHSVTVVYRKP